MCVNVKGLEFVEADKVLLLLRALPPQCRQCIVLNAPDESFSAYVESALRYEAQQRIWSDLNGKPIAALNAPGDKGKGTDSKGKGKGKDKAKEGKGSDTRGKGKGGSDETRTCFTCGQRGHLSVDCPSRGKGKSKGDAGKDRQKGKGSSGKSSEKGKKGDAKGHGKPKGKRATEFSLSQPESEAAVSGRNQRLKMEVGCLLSSFVRVPTCMIRMCGW